MKKMVFSSMFLVMIMLLPVFLHAQEDEGTGGQTGRYGDDSVTCITNISLYREFFKQWKASGYKNEIIYDAYKPWHWVFMNCPKSTENAYIDGIKMVSFFIESDKDPAQKNKYIDTLMMVYDQRIKYFGKEGYILGRKGVDLYKYRPEDFEKVYYELKKSVEIEGNKTEGPVIVYYFRASIAMVKSSKMDTATLVDAYDVCMTIVDFNMKKNAENQKELADWEIVKGNIELSFEPYATCKDLIPIYRKKFTATPDDLELLKKITGMLDKKNCQEDALYFETTKKLYELEPSPEAAYLIGKLLLKDGQYDEAIKYFKQAEGMQDTISLSKAYKYISQSYKSINNYSTARTYAIKAAQLNPNDGEVYLLIGDMYAESATSCGDNELTKKVAFWAAVDKYNKARQVDPTLDEIARKRISDYSVYFPSSETVFFYNLREGDEYTVECWINEKTTVRAAKQ